MKKLITSYILGASLLASSCNVLNIEPLDQISSNQAFSTINDAQGVVNGMYHNLQTIYMWRLQVITDVASDMSQQVDTWDALIAADEFNWGIDNSEVEDLYTPLYRCIDIANNIIAYVPPLQADQSVKDDLIGQAYFIRGLAYFDLSRLWGGYPEVYGTDGVVIKLTPSSGLNAEDFATRSTLRQSYDQAESDLLEALRLLPETRSSATLNKAKTTKSAARALLARYYLYNRNWPNAESYASDAIGSSTLSTPFATAFTTKNSAESIFELQFSNVDGMGLRQWYFPASLGGRGGSALHDEMYAEMTANPADVRGAFTALNTSSGTYYTTKWSTVQNADNFQLLRMAEQFLIRAEARAQQDKLALAADDLDVVRTRAGIANTTASTKTELLDAILQERKLEFVGEGHRWFDVIRSGKAMDIFSNVIRSKGSLPFYRLSGEGRQVLPLPSVETRTNTNLVQNEAYR